MAMVAPYPIGFETGDASEITTLGTGASVQQTVVLSGAYSLKQEGTESVISIGHALSAWAFRCRVRFTGGWYTRSLFEFRSASATTMWTLGLDASQLLVVTQVAAIGLTTTVGVTPLELDHTYSVKVAFDGASSGILRVWLSDTLPAGQAEIDVTHSSAASNLERVVVNWSTTGNNCYLDDFALFNTADRPADGKVRMSQGKGGTPSANAWTTEPLYQPSAYVWSKTPHSSTKYTVDTGSGTAQMMVVSPFSRGTPIQDIEVGPIDTTFDLGDIYGGTGTSSELEQAAGQSFIPNRSGDLLRVALKLWPNNTPQDNLILEVLSGSLTGTVLGSSSLAASSVQAPGSSSVALTRTYFFDFPAGVTLTSGTKYYLRLSRDGARDVPNSVGHVFHATTSFLSNCGFYTRDNNVWSSESAGDWWFITWMEGPTNTDYTPNTPDVITNLDVVNAGKTVVNAKRSGGTGSTHQIRRRLNAADTDTTVTLTTGDAFYQDGPWTANQSDLDTAEIGAVRTGGSQTMTVHTAWLMVDYEPLRQVPNASLQGGAVQVDLLYRDSSNEVRAIKVWNSLGVDAQWRVIKDAVDETITIDAGAVAQTIVLTTAVTDVDGLHTSLSIVG